MWSIDAAPSLVGGEISTDDGEPPMSLEQEISVTCGNCQLSFNVRSAFIAHRYYPTIMCHGCEQIIAIQYGDDPFKLPWEILDVSDEISTGTLSDSRGNFGGFSVYDEQSDELTSLHKAGECLARATSQEFPSDGHYSIEAMNTVLVSEPGGTAVGYLTWNTFESETSTYPALRQLYFMPAYRRFGLGSALVEFWVENVVDDFVAETPNNVYCVEQPNEAMRGLIRSLGHHKENEDGPKASVYTPNQM